MAEAGKRPGAATAAGVLEIVFGAIGAIVALVGGLIGSLATAGAAYMTDSSVVGGGTVAAVGTIILIASILTLILSIIGLIAGIMIMSSKKAGIGLSQVYIWGSLVVTVAMFIIKIVGGLGPDIVSLIIGAVIPVVILILIMNKAVKEYFAAQA